MDLLPWLQQNPLLHGFTEDGMRIIQSVCVPRQLEAGSPIFVQRMQGESLFMLAHGEVAVVLAKNGIEREIGVLQAPDAFGEMSLIVPAPRRVTVRARTPVALIEIPRRDFLNLQKQRPQACLKLQVSIAERFAAYAAAAGNSFERLVD